MESMKFFNQSNKDRSTGEGGTENDEYEIAIHTTVISGILHLSIVKLPAKETQFN
jgi:hypothetical protein